MWRIYTTYFVLTLVTIEKEPFRITSISILFHFVRNKNQIKSNQIKKGCCGRKSVATLESGLGSIQAKRAKGQGQAFSAATTAARHL